jgi:gluconokinase
MGVSGCGKTTVARLLAEKTGGVYWDADDFHPPENKAKMSAGQPLTDADRWPWLDVMNARLREQSLRPEPLFLACSALRAVYRERLASGLAEVRWIYLSGSFELIYQRMQQRSSHFMPPQLLQSQFAILEEPTDALVLSIEQPPEVLVEQVLKA